MNHLAVECQGLAKSFNGISAVEDLSLSVEEGSLVALVGPSGCGKTTALRLIAGFDPPDSGTVAIRGRIVSSPNGFVPAERRRVGMVFQDYALFPHLTVRENVAYGLPKGPERNWRTDAVLELVELTSISPRFPHELSGGEQQRVALARALAPNPAIVLLDEPFSNLDAGLRVNLRSQVKGILKEMGTSAIFVTHDQEEAMSLANRLGVMLAGRIEQMGAPEEIYACPSSLAVASFLGDANLLDGEAADGRVTTELGALETNVAAQGRVKVMIRSEVVRLHKTGPGHPEPEAGLVLEVIGREFYGHDQVVRLRLPSGLLFRARCGPDQAIDPGDLVATTVDTPVFVFPTQ